MPVRRVAVIQMKTMNSSIGRFTLAGSEQAGNDPKSHAMITSSIDIGPRLSFDATLRYVGSLPNPALDSYYDINASLNWRAGRHLDLGLSGFNLLRPRHLEYPPPNGRYVVRSLIAQARWRL